VVQVARSRDCSTGRRRKNKASAKASAAKAANKVPEALVDDTTPSWVDKFEERLIESERSIGVEYEIDFVYLEPDQDGAHLIQVFLNELSGDRLIHGKWAMKVGTILDLLESVDECQYDIKSLRFYPFPECGDELKSLRYYGVLANRPHLELFGSFAGNRIRLFICW